MKVKNISNQNQVIPGTQPNCTFRFIPGEEVEIPDYLIGFVSNKEVFQILGDVSVEYKKVEISTPEVTVTKEEIKTPTETITSESASSNPPEHLVVSSENVQPVSQAMDRIIICPQCEKKLKSKNPNFDDRVLKMHLGRFHKQSSQEIEQTI